MHATHWTFIRRLSDWALRVRPTPGARRFSPWDVIA
jgi:hypothetical protein